MTGRKANSKSVETTNAMGDRIYEVFLFVKEVVSRRKDFNLVWKMRYDNKRTQNIRNSNS
jgi:hypothetical protein